MRLAKRETAPRKRGAVWTRRTTMGGWSSTGEVEPTYLNHSGCARLRDDRGQGVGRRIFAYVDGFNLYYGLKAKGWERYRWLDVHALIESMVRPPDTLIKTVYFTAMSTNPPERYRRHKTYVDALTRATPCTLEFGFIEQRSRSCPECGHGWKRPQEKQTDVRLALAMVIDTLVDPPDEVFVLSADSDLIPAIERVQANGIAVTVLRPPRRRSDALSAVADRTLHIPRNKFAQARLPNPVTYLHRGKERQIHCPEEWLDTQEM